MKHLFDYRITGLAAIFFFILALVDLLMMEDKNDPDRWRKSWEYLSLFGKIDVIIFVGLFIWSIALGLGLPKLFKRK